MVLQILLVILWINVSMNNCDPIYPAMRKDYFYRSRPMPPKQPEIQYAFIVEDCGHKGDSKPVAMNDLVLLNDYGLIIFWNRNMNANWKTLTDFVSNATYEASDDIQGIFDCTITVKLGPHDPRISYQELILGIIKQVKFKETPFNKNVTDSIDLLDVENTLANRGLRELNELCRPAETECKRFGCVRIEYGDKNLTTCESELKNIGDKLSWYTRDDVRIRIMAIGTFVGKGKNNENVIIYYPPVNQIVRLEFTRLYAGPCYNNQQFYCRLHGLCIKKDLACDFVGMYNCPVFPQRSDGIRFDEPDSCSQEMPDSVPIMNIPDSQATTNLYIFWILLGIFLSLLAYLLLNYCFWRPGYLIWRCGRLRNWFAFGNCCYKSCHQCSKTCDPTCCKTAEKFDTTEVSTINWSKYPAGDGFHMRENR